MSEDASGTSAVPSIYQQLAARFPASAHKTRKQGGRDLTYVDGEMVVSRLNEALGFDGWSFEVKGVTVLDDEVWAQGRLTVYSGERTIIREQTGGQIINRTRGQPAIAAQPADGERPAIQAQPARKGDVIELANDIKGAVTDCLKKCATLVGVGLYLYDPEERREVENEMAAVRRQPRPLAPPANTSNARTIAPSPAAAAPVVTPKVDAAARLTGAPSPAESPFKYADVRERFKAAAEYARLVKVATQTGYQHAEKVRAKQAKDLSDHELEGSIRVLRKWELSQAPEQEAAG
jgi:hypothetical protein